MNIKKALEPKDLEEIKPGFFIQKKGDSYRQVHPLVWKGKWMLKGQIKWMNIILVIILIGLAIQGAKFLRFYEEVNSDPVAFCRDVQIISPGNFGVRNEDTNTVQFNIGETPTTHEP